ncbi:MAG TPA: flagellar hook-length control protein FliK [Rhodocyclaceae bacterium]
MALIPPDAGIRMRMQTESALQPLTPVQEIPSDLPDLRPGQLFSARIQEVMPENTYRALVAGKTITLALPEGAKAGDTLELVVVDRTVRTIVARSADAQTLQGQGAAEPYPHTTLSPAGRLIGQLLQPQGEALRPALLNQGQPLLASPPALPGQAAELAPKLAQAVQSSGLFYEAHQAQWVAGKIDPGPLLQEPQGQHSSPKALTALAERPALLPLQSEAAESGNSLQLTTNTDNTPTRAHQAAAEPAQQSLLQKIPEDLRPLVQQQLDAAATQRMVWHGEVWPGQPMDWEIEREAPDRRPDGSLEENAWTTTLALTTPRLGRVDARIRLTPQGVSLAMAAMDPQTADDLRNSAPGLADALAAAGVTLTGLQVKHVTAE